MAVVVSLCIIRKSYISGCILINAHYCCGGGGGVGVFFFGHLSQFVGIINFGSVTVNYNLYNMTYTTCILP